MNRPYKMEVIGGDRGLAGLYLRPKMYQVSAMAREPALFDRYVIPPKSIPELIIYAPPHSGKTTFVKEVHDTWCKCPLKRLSGNIDYITHTHYLVDTDYCMFSDNNIVITNRHELIKLGRQSVSLVPSEIVFRERCEMRGIKPGPSWYEDLLRNTSKSDILLTSDDWLGNLIKFSQL